MKIFRHIWLVIPFFLCSCAMTRSYVDLAYIPSETREILDSALGVQIHVHVVDDRENKEVIGHKKNGLGMRMAPILSNNSLEILVLEAIKKELSDLGFVMREESSLLVDVAIEKFYNQFNLGLFNAHGSSEIILTVKVITAEGEELFHEQIIGRGKESPVFLLSGNNAKIALEKALVAAISNMVANEHFLTALLQ